MMAIGFTSKWDLYHKTPALKCKCQEVEGPGPMKREAGGGGGGVSVWIFICLSRPLGSLQETG